MKKTATLTERILSAVGLVRKNQIRAYDGSAGNRLTADWFAAVTTGDSEIRQSIKTIRARCREQERDSDYARRYYSALENNILKDEVGFSLQMKVNDVTGTPDTAANNLIEDGWRDFSRRENFTVNGEDGIFDVCKLALRSAARDGGVMFKRVYDSSLKYGFALQPLEIDHLDVTYFTTMQNGNYVFMGVEKNKFGRVEAYHLLTRHPGDTSQYSGSQYRERVLAADVIHYFSKERFTQSVGVPWLCSAMTRLNHLKQYEVAELVAARHGAEKGGWFRDNNNEGYKGDGTQNGNPITDSQPGNFDVLPAGMEFVQYDPKHPTDAFGPFVKSTLRGVAAGGGISYMALTGDLSEANFSSMRAGRLEELEFYKKIQTHMVRHFMLPVFESWIESALVKGALGRLPFSKLEKFNAPKFTGRRWPWIDPKTDIEAALMAINGGVSTRTKFTEENGEDFEETLATLKMEKDLADNAGLKFAMPGVGGSGIDNSASNQNAPAP